MQARLLGIKQVMVTKPEINRLTPASAELGTAQLQLVFLIYSFLVTPGGAKSKVVVDGVKSKISVDGTKSEVDVGGRSTENAEDQKS